MFPSDRPPRACLVGDSVLDSGIWCTQANRNCAYYLERMGFVVDDLSTDGNRVVDVTVGARMTSGAPRRPFVWHRRIHGLPAYRDVPLDELAPSDVTVLSLGGNDLLHCLRRVKLTADAIERDLAARRVGEQYRGVARALATRGGRLVLVVPYTPNQRDPVGKVMGGLTRKLMPRLVPAWYYATARALDARVVDLSLAFDPWDDQLYGSTAIEPSELGARRIAELVAAAAEQSAPAPMLTADEYADALDAHLARCEARPREPIALDRVVWKIHRTMYFHALLLPISLARIVYLLLVTNLISDRQRMTSDSDPTL